MVQDKGIVQFPESLLLVFRGYGDEEEVTLGEFHGVVCLLGFAVDVCVSQYHLIEDAGDEGIVVGLANERIQHRGYIDLSRCERFGHRPPVLLYIVVSG